MSQRILRAAALLVCVMSLPTATASGQVLYATVPGADSPLYRINPVDGTSTTVGNIGFGITGLAFNPLTGELFGTQAGVPGGGPAAFDRNLIRINVNTGAGTIVGPIGLGIGGIADIAFRSDGTLFGWSENTDALITINTTTGAGTLVGTDPGISTRGSGLAFNAAGVLYLAGNNASGPLRTVNTTTGQTTVGPTLSGGPHPTQPVPAMKFHPVTDVLYAVNRQVAGTGTTFLITINTTTGAITTIAPTVSRIDGLAWSLGPSISGTPPAASLGVPYTFTFTGVGGAPPRTFDISAGALPPGLSLSAAGVVSGTPTTPGIFPFTVRFTDSAAQTATLSTSITVISTAISISGTPPQLVLNQPYSFAFTATGNGTLTFALTAGALPAGVVLTPAGVLTGTPTTSGAHPITVRVTDSTAATASRSVILLVQDPNPPPPPPNRPPTITGLSDITIEENRTVPPIAITLGDDFTSPNQLFVTVTPGDATILSNVSLTGTGASRTLQITLAEDREGLASVSITAGDGSLSTTATARITVTPAPVPDPPTGLTAVQEGAGIRFSWQAPAAGAVPTFYLLESGNASGVVNYPVINTGRATTVVTVLPTGLWFVRVRSGNSAGTSLPSPEVAGPIGSGVPGAPRGFGAAVVGEIARLSWQLPVDGGPVVTWRLELGSALGLIDRGVFFGLPASVLTVSERLPAGQYYARVRGINDAGTGTASNEASFIVGAIAPCALGIGDPPVLFPAAVANRLVTLTWRAPTNTPITSYRILVGTAPGLANLATFDIGAVTSLAAEAPPGRYFVALVARNSCGDSLPSNTIVVDVP